VRAVLDWWKRQLAKVGQRFEDNPNGVQFVQADTLQTAKPPEFVCVSPVGGVGTPGIVLSRNTTTGALSWTTQFQNGVAPVTEASAVASYDLLSYLRAYIRRDMPAIIAEPYSATVATLIYTGRRIGRARITCDGAGAWANEALVPALAGYYGVCRFKGIKANAIVAAGQLTFESPAATAALPSVEVMPALAANVRQDRDLVITHATLVDNQAIVVDGAGFGAATVVDLEWEYWYET